MNLTKLLKIVWIGFAVSVLVLVVYGFDGKPNSDIAVILVWGMLAVSAPAGLVVPLVHSALYDVLSVSIPTSYFSLVVDWLAFFALGYIQWFKLLPALLRRVSSLLKRSAENG